MTVLPSPLATRPSAPITGYWSPIADYRSSATLPILAFALISLASAAQGFSAERAGSLQPVITTNYVVVTNIVVVTNYVTILSPAPSSNPFTTETNLSTLHRSNAPTSALPDLSWVPPLDSFDWIQLKTGEWLKGRIKAMQERQIEFFSEKLSDLTFDWKDIRQVRSPRTIDVLFTDGKKVSGPVTVTPEQVTVNRSWTRLAVPRRMSFPVTSCKASRRAGPRSGITGRSTCRSA